MTFTEELYVKVNAKAKECSFRAFKIVNVAFVVEGSLLLKPHLSKSTLMGLKIIVGKGTWVGKGLGKFLGVNLIH